MAGSPSWVVVDGRLLRCNVVMDHKRTVVLEVFGVRPRIRRMRKNGKDGKLFCRKPKTW